MEQVLFYIPHDLPLPNSDEFVPAITGRIAEILRLSSGRALVLFTSYNNLNSVYNALKGKISYRILRQGEAPKNTLLEDFKRNTGSVLMATGSFWEGVDVPGEALSCLIVDKLPFDSPGDPIVGARIDMINTREGNPFMEYQVPSAIISLKQGLGRLIRKSTDRGILAVLDKRIVKSSYGRFL
jgi:ATP-dependent DNA helicase DinG